ncbi:McrB family protein [Rhizobium leguminosarum]|uniref:McrB family protein n=1 Tax=Rhizobium leguminosarum TaxID=384 RepID=UPI003F9D433B
MAIMKVFAGPPGTGKTWNAARQAVELLRPGTTVAEVQRVHEELVDEGRIVWVTFHPSYSYEDFVEGFRPEETPTGNVVYSIVQGPFLRACRTASAAVSANRFNVGQLLGPRDQYRVTHVEAGGLVLATVANRRGDAVAGEDDEPAQAFVDFWTLKKFADLNLPASDLRLPGTNYDRKKEVARLAGVPTTFFSNSSRHAAVYEALQAEGVVIQPTEVVMVIDEINRADLSRVFGELITLLEFDKRQGASEERRVTLTYSGNPLSVPATLSVVGTMNTADKSLSTVDLALRRRFEFVLVSPNPLLTPQNYGGVDVRAMFTMMNRRLMALNGSENLIGHADFMSSKLEELRDREAFAGDANGRLAAIAHTLRNKTVPFLVDLFRGDQDLVRFVVGSDMFDEDPLDDLSEALEALGRLDSHPLVTLALWWDPRHPTWDGARFAARYAANVNVEG